MLRFHFLVIKVVGFYAVRVLEHTPYFSKGYFKSPPLPSLNCTQERQSLAERRIDAGY